MKLEIRWSASALLSLAEVLEYTTIEHSERQAIKLRRQVMTAIQRLVIAPFSAPVEPCSEQIGVELRGLTVIKRLKIIYSVGSDAIYIEYVKNTYLSDETMLERIGLVPKS